MKDSSYIYTSFATSGAVQINVKDVKNPIINYLSTLSGEGYNDSVFVVDESNVLILGYDYRIIYVDISDPNNL